MSTLLPYIVIGITSGAVYGLTGLGLVLTYRTSGVFNFGYGAIAAAGAFVFFQLHDSHGVPWPIAAVITVLVLGPIMGLVMELLARLLTDIPQVLVLVATIGVLLAVQGYLLTQFGDVSQPFPNFLPTSGFHISNVSISWAEVTTVVFSIVVAGGLYLFLRRARLGVAMRAVVDNPALVSLAGHAPVRIRRASWIVGCCLAAASGMLIAPSSGLDATILSFLIVQAFGAVAIGLFSSLPLTFVGGLAVGLIQSLATKYTSAHALLNGLPTASPFLVLFVVLLVVPVRKFPQVRAGLGTLIVSARRLRPKTIALVGVVVGGGMLTVPLWAGPKLPLWISAVTYLVLFASLSLLVWTSGQISLCQVAFAALGATTFSHFQYTDHIPWLIALGLAGLVTAPVGAVIAIPAIRLSGVYLALATFGFGVFMQDVIYNQGFMFGPTLTAQAGRPNLGFLGGVTDKSYYFVVLAIGAASVGLLVLVARSRLGRLLRALSESPVMLATHGLTITVTRVTVFMISAFFAGIAGALMISQSHFEGSSGFPAETSLLLLAVLGICGTRLVSSSMLAAGLIAIVPGYLTWLGTDQQELAFGIAAISAVILYAVRPQVREFLTSAGARSASRRQRSPVRSRLTQRPITQPPLVRPPATEGSISTPPLVSRFGR